MALPALLPAPSPTRPNVVRVAIWLAIAASTMLVAGTLAHYFQVRDAFRDGGGEWIASDSLPNAALAVTYLSLLMSSFTAQWAVAAIKLDDRRQAYVAVGTTLLLGAAFINGLAFSWSQVGLAAGDGGPGDAMYTVTVTHLLLLVAAMVLWVVMGFRVLGGAFGPKSTELLAAAASYWHFAVAAGAVVYWCVWFLEGGPG